MNDFLQSILDINHRIVRESNPKRLLQQICDLLMDNPGHRHAWLAIVSRDGGIVDVYSAGEKAVDTELLEYCQSEQQPACLQEAIETDGVVEMGDRLSENRCATCSLAELELDNSTIQYALDVPEGRGVLTVCLDQDAETCSGAKRILATVAEDLSFALQQQVDRKRRLQLEPEHKKALAEAQEGETHYKTVFENLGDAIFIHDFGGDIVEVNEAACEQLGYARNELLNMNVIDIDINFERCDTFDMETQLREEGDSITRSVHETSDGQHVPVETHSRIIKFEGEDLVLSVTRNIEARQRANEQKNRLLEAVRAAQEAIIVTSPEGEIIFANQAVMDLFGQPRESLIGEKVWNLIGSDDSKAEVDGILEALDHEKGWEGEIPGRDSNGTVFPCYATVTAVRDEDGKVLNYIATANDISDQKETETELRETVEELRKTERQVIDQERQRALSQMASGIAHDFNNSLSTIRGFTELLLQDGEKRSDEEVLSKYLSVIDSAASNAADTVSRMKKFYRPAEQAEMRSLDINNLVDEAVSLTRPKWEQEAQASGKTITIEQDLRSTRLVKGNEAELHEMLANIIFNAVDAIEEKGCIEIRTRQDGGSVLLEVQDDGVGMETYTRRHCADPFYTTKGEAGTGLGLAVTSGIIRRHEGELEIESEVGEGSLVRVILPVDDNTETIDVPETTEESYENGETLKILVAEDDLAQQELLEDMLDVLGHESDIVGDGAEALERFETGKYDMIITDRAMPEVRGDEVAEEVRRQNANMPIVMITGFGDMMEAASEHPENVDLVISKPLSLKKLSSAIEDACDTHDGE